MKFPDTKARVDAVLSAAKGRLRLSFIAERLQLPEEEVEFALYELQSQMQASDSGKILTHNHGGWRVEIKPQFQKEIARIFPERAAAVDPSGPCGPGRCCVPPAGKSCGH
jgi:chromosome segregation and condensation protein ScpB